MVIDGVFLCVICSPDASEMETKLGGLAARPLHVA
jgi:hypothetical protein